MRAAFLLASILTLAMPGLSYAELLLIVHPDNPIRELNRKQASDLYFGRVTTVTGDGRSTAPALTLYDQPGDSSSREQFYRALNGMPLSQVNAYWARLRFSGDVMPPHALPDYRAVVEAVRRNPKGVGYIDAASAHDSVRVVLRLREY